MEDAGASSVEWHAVVHAPTQDCVEQLILWASLWDYDETGGPSPPEGAIPGPSEEARRTAEATRASQGAFILHTPAGAPGSRGEVTADPAGKITVALRPIRGWEQPQAPLEYVLAPHAEGTDVLARCRSPRWYGAHRRLVFVLTSLPSSRLPRPPGEQQLRALLDGPLVRLYGFVVHILETTQEAYGEWLSWRVSLCYDWLETEELAYYQVGVREAARRQPEVRSGPVTWEVYCRGMAFRPKGVPEYLGERGLTLLRVVSLWLAPDLIDIQITSLGESLVPCAHWLEADSEAAFGRPSAKDALRDLLEIAASDQEDSPVDAVRARMVSPSGMPSAEVLAERPSHVLQLDTDGRGYLDWLEQAAPRHGTRLLAEGRHAYLLREEPLERAEWPRRPDVPWPSRQLLVAICDLEPIPGGLLVRITALEPVDEWAEAVADLLQESVRAFSGRLLFDGEEDLGHEAGLVDEAREDEPWLVVPADGWEREAVRLWWAGSSNAEIAAEVTRQGWGVNGKTVTKRLFELRKRYGNEVVPYDKDRRRQPETRDSDP